MRYVTMPKPGFDEKEWDFRNHDEKEREAAINKYYVGVPRVEMLATDRIVDLIDGRSIDFLAYAAEVLDPPKWNHYARALGIGK